MFYNVEHKFYYEKTISLVGHMPLGLVFPWLTDIFSWANNMTERHEFLVEARGKRPGFNYVVWSHGLIR